MKVNLSFSLPEEREELSLAQNGPLYACVLSEFDNYLRGKIKYENLTEIEHGVFEAVREKLYKIANEYEVNIHG